MSATLQGNAGKLIDLSVGSVLRALLEASASIALWMQWLILQVLSMTRAATSVGTDLDSWMADFSLVRLPGAPSEGSVTFGRYTVGVAASIPVGAVIRTTDVSQSFVVVEDQSNPAWGGLANYVVASDIAAVSLPVQALLPGTAGNVVAGAIGLLGSAIPGIDYVVNSAAFYSGVDAESDAALRTRFQLYINSRSLATVDAVGAAIESTQQGLRYCVLENVDRDGNVAPGHFCVFVDDGSGNASNSLLASVNAAVDFVRPLGSTYSISKPSVVTVAVQMSIVLSGGSLASTIAVNVQKAIVTWIQGLPMGATLALSKLEAIAHDADLSVLSVTNTQINGSSLDLSAAAGAALVVGPVNVTAT